MNRGKRGVERMAELKYSDYGHVNMHVTGMQLRCNTLPPAIMSSIYPKPTLLRCVATSGM